MTPAGRAAMLAPPDLREDELREIIYGDYRILYRVGETAEVLAVRHGSLPLTSVDLDQD